jgi:hypothetical protein
MFEPRPEIRITIDFTAVSVSATPGRTLTALAPSPPMPS